MIKLAGVIIIAIVLIPFFTVLLVGAVATLIKAIKS